jgi:gluconate 2-dehydrogenase gamma chain
MTSRFPKPPFPVQTQHHCHRTSPWPGRSIAATLFGGTALALLGESVGRGGVLDHQLPWRPNADQAEPPVVPGPWQYFSALEGAMVESIVDRLIPADPQTPGGKDAGCAVFIDRQLAGAYGRAEGLYTMPPFSKGTKQQGPQSQLTPAQMYRGSLAALDRHARSAYGGKAWTELAGAEQDDILHGLESGTLQLEGADGKTFFEALLKDTQEGFFADPIYGGNRDMCAWKMIGFPGARYDYRDWVGRHNERYPRPPVSIQGRPDWTARKS